MYIKGGKINIIADPKTAPDKDPTFPISVNKDANNPINVNNSPDMILILAIFSNEGIDLAVEINQFLITKNTKGKLANTDVPNANNDIIAKGSLGEKEFNANDADFSPNNLNDNRIVPK